jgi:cardiolipin synthase
MKKIFLDDQSMSTPLHEIPQRLNPSFIKRLGESVIRLVSPLL